MNTFIHLPLCKYNYISKTHKKGELLDQKAYALFFYRYWHLNIARYCHGNIWQFLQESLSKSPAFHTPPATKSTHCFLLFCPQEIFALRERDFIEVQKQRSVRVFIKTPRAAQMGAASFHCRSLTCLTRHSQVLMLREEEGTWGLHAHMDNVAWRGRPPGVGNVPSGSP